MVSNMKKSRKLILWVVLLSILAIFGIYFAYRIINDPTRLTPIENEWLNSNLNKVQNVAVVNDTNVFGMSGKGVFYDFLNDFSENYGLKINSITYNASESSSGLSFEVSNTLEDNDVNFFQDHYVLVSKNSSLIFNEEALKDKKIGVLADSLPYIESLLDVHPSFLTYNSRDELIKSLDSNANVDAILVPRIEYMDTILLKDYFIVYHFSNIIRYYNLNLDYTNSESLSNILSKYFKKWEMSSFDKSLYDQEFQMFVKNLSISQTEIDQLQSVVYNYGFINNSPYEILSGGNYGGIIATYLNEFSKFSGVEFNFKRYKNYKKLVSEIDQNQVDMYFEYYNFTTSGTDISSNFILTYDIVAPLKDELVVSSLKSLKGKTVYVEDNSLLYSRLSSISDITLKTYEGEKGLKEAIKNNELIILDHNMNLFYHSNYLKNYSTRYTSSFDVTYSFRTNTNATFTKLFTKYIDYLDENKMMNLGMYHHNVTKKKGTLLGSIAKYFLYIVVIAFVLFYIVYRSSKRIRLAKKIRREDKMKFIDQLTSLKNRNYLNENISKWNKNTIYPQSMIVIDLNRIQEINDVVSYEQGDAQIKAAANILIKTQLDNSDVMRTDGNEFMIYLVGYQAKQITSYIHKLNKEFNNLPYNYGAAIGYSMIVDDIKSIEDAINEAIEDVKKQKEAQKEEREHD